MQHVTGETDEISRAFRIHAWEPLAVEAVWLKIYRVDFYSSEIKRKKEKKRERKRMEFWNPFKKWGIYFCCSFVSGNFIIFRSKWRYASGCARGIRNGILYVFLSYERGENSRLFFFFEVENLISLLFEYLVILLFVRDGRYAKWNRRSDTFDLSFLYLSEFYLPFFFFFLFFYICDLLRLLFGTSNETTRGDYKIIL